MGLYQLEKKSSDSATEQFEAKLGAVFDQLQKVHDKLATVSEKLDQLYETVGVPRGDTPTVEELLADAKSDIAKRKLLETTLAELEFSDPQIEFN